METNKNSFDDNQNGESINDSSTFYMNFNGLNISLDILEKQSYSNLTVFPIKSDYFAKKDFITLKKAYEMGLVEIKELEHSQVDTIFCKNDAVVPLLLIDGDEIIGAMQNRIINDSMLVPANSHMNIPVSCTEHGRWRYESDKRDFSPSLFSLDFSSRRHKSRAAHENRDYQCEVWDSISELEGRHSFRSKTSALKDNYEHSKVSQDDYLKNYEIKKGQNGAIFFINGVFKGFELFYNHSIYKEYHEKTFRSYIIEAIASSKSNKEIDEGLYNREINSALNDISSAVFEKHNTLGLGYNYKFGTESSSGSGLVFEDELIHMTYFKDDSNKNYIII